MMNKQVQDLRARYNANGNAIIPNTFQHPNVFVDRLMYYLSPVENVVLTFAVRRILGFQTNIMSRKDNISLSQFTDGITAEDGHALSMGCGLGLDSVSNALQALETYKILIPTTEKPDPKRGQEYWLQENENNIDWLGLEERKNNRKSLSYKRTEKARYSVGQKGTVGQDTSPLSDSTLDSCGTETQNPQKPTETQLGDKSPILQPANLSIENQIYAGVSKVVPPDDTQAKRRDIASLIATGLGVNYAAAVDLVMAFQNERNITFTESDVKAQRKAVRTLLEKNATPSHVQAAVRKLTNNKMTFVDLFGVIKTVTDLLSQPEPEKIRLL